MKSVELIDKDDYLAIAINRNSETFVMHIAALKALLKMVGIVIHLF